MNGRGKAMHWADMLAARYAPSKEVLIAEAVQRIEDEQELEIEALMRQANGEPPLPPKEERIAAEHARLEAMTTEQIVAERAEEERTLRELIEQANARSAAAEAHIKAIYGKAPDSPEMFL